MKKLLENMQLMPKILSTLLLLGVVTTGIAITAYFEMITMDAHYSEEVDKNLPATTAMVRVNRYAAQMLAVGHSATTYDVRSAETQGAPRKATSCTSRQSSSWTRRSNATRR